MNSVAARTRLRRFGARTLVIALAAGSTVLVGGTVAKAADETPPPSDAAPLISECRARAAYAFKHKQTDVANGKLTPCESRRKQVVNENILIPGDVPVFGDGAIHLGVEEVYTVAEPDAANAFADISQVYINIPSLPLTVQATDLYSNARSQLTSCDEPATLSGISRIGTLIINGSKYTVGSKGQDHIKISLGADKGFLYTNYRKASGNELIRRTIWLDLPGKDLDIAVGETRAGIACDEADLPPLPPPNPTPPPSGGGLELPPLPIVLP